MFTRYRRNGFGKFTQRRYRRTKSKYATVSYALAIARSQNDPNDAAQIQRIITTQVPGAVTSWNGIAYRVLPGNELFQLFTAAFNNTTSVKIAGFKITGSTDSSSTLMVCYRQRRGEPLRVITGIGRVYGGFMFMGGVLPHEIIVIGETDSTFKLRFSYSTNVIRSSV